MLKTLKEFFTAGLPTGAPRTDGGSSPSGVQLAAAVLLVEISLADSNLSADERKVLEEALARRFQLTAVDARTVLSLAEQEVDRAVSLFEYTRLINSEFTRKEREEIVQLLWEVAYADAVLDKHEEYYIRKIADLLHVSHPQLIKAKHKAFKEK